MGPRGLYINKWGLDFNLNLYVTISIPFLVKLPHLSIHFWNQYAFIAIGNTLGKYIDLVGPKDNLSCAKIYIKLDLEERLPLEIKFQLNDWEHIQPLDYNQLPFKCRYFHEYSHFA